MNKRFVTSAAGGPLRLLLNRAAIDVRFLVLALLLVLVGTISQAVAQTFFDQPRDFLVATACDAHTSIKKQTEPVALVVGEAYRALGENKATEATHAFIELGGARKWVALTCGSYAGASTPAPADECLAFFDQENNPEPIPGFGAVDITPPPPDIAAFGQSVNEVCGAPGKRVSRGEFRALFTEHPQVLDRLIAFTRGRVFADRPPPVDPQGYLSDLEDAWFAIHGFDHIFCGEPKAGGSIGGFHFRGRYLQLQEQGVACRMADNRQNEEVVHGSVYTLGVVIHMDGGTARKDIKGYGLTLSAEDILKVVTRAFAENPTRRTDSTGCLLNIEDDGERFTTVFVRRKSGIRTFYPDATPSGPACAAAIALPPAVPSDDQVNSAPVRMKPLCLPRLAVGQLTQVPIPADSFFDADGDTLNLSVSLEGGQALPLWADFDPNGNVLLFLPGDEDAGTEVRIAVTVDDGQNQVREIVTTEVAGGE